MKFIEESKIIENDSSNLFDLKQNMNKKTIEKNLIKNPNIFNEENDKDNSNEDILNTGFYLDYNDKELKDIKCTIDKLIDKFNITELEQYFKLKKCIKSKEINLLFTNKNLLKVLINSDNKYEYKLVTFICLIFPFLSNVGKNKILEIEFNPNLKEYLKKNILLHSNEIHTNDNDNLYHYHLIKENLKDLTLKEKYFDNIKCTLFSLYQILTIYRIVRYKSDKALKNWNSYYFDVIAFKLRFILENKELYFSSSLINQSDFSEIYDGLYLIKIFYSSILKYGIKEPYIFTKKAINGDLIFSFDNYMLIDKEDMSYNEEILFNDRDNYIYKQIMEKIEFFYKIEDISDLMNFSNYSTLNSENSNFIFNMIELITRKYKYINNNFKTFKKNLILLEKEIYNLAKDSCIFEEYLDDKDKDKEKQEVKKYKLDKKKSFIFNKIKEIISKNVDVKYKDKFSIYPIGSSTQFLGSNNSDLDTYLDLTKLSPYDKEIFILTLQNLFKIKKPLVISRRVCVLTIEYNEVEIDISLLALCPYIHSLLFREYSLMDPRFPLVAISLKKFIKNLGLTKKGNELFNFLNSFSWISLLVAFLQDIIEPPILPKIFSHSDKNDSKIICNIEYGNFYYNKKRYYKPYKNINKLREFLNNIKCKNVELPSCLFNKDELRKIYDEQIGKNPNKNNMSCAEILLEFLEFIIFYFKCDIIYSDCSEKKEGFENIYKLKNNESEFGKYYNKTYSYFNKVNGMFLIRDPIDPYYNPAQTLKDDNFEEFIENLKYGYVSLIKYGSLDSMID